MTSASGSGPYLQRHDAAQNQWHDQKQLILNRGGYGDQDFCRDRQRRIQTGVQLGESRYDVGQNHGNHNYGKDNQKRRIDQRIEKTFPDREDRLLVLHISRDDFNKVAAALPGVDRSRVDGRENPLGPQRLGKHGSRMDTVPHVFNVLAQQGVTDAVLQKIQAAKDRQAGPDQRDELLVEHDEVIRLDDLPSPARPQRDRPAAPPDRNRQKSLLVQPVLDFIRILGDQHDLDDLAGGLSVFARKFHGIESGRRLTYWPIPSTT